MPPMPYQLQVLETFVRGKLDDDSSCEDSIFVSDTFVAIMDGATDKTGKRYEGQAGGRFATQIIGQTLETLSSSITARKCIDALSEQLAYAVDAIDPAERDRPSATLLMFSAAHGQIWRVGGDTFHINGKSHTRRKPTEVIAARARALYLKELLLEGSPQEELQRNDPGRELILPLLTKEYLYRNSPKLKWAFGALDGSHVPDSLIEVIPLRDPCEIVFATDGYPRVAATLAKTEALLERSLANDPLRIGSPATKGLRPGQSSFDDRAYIRFRASRST
jgi:glycerophosphoryl diester phosphodiesterase